MTTFVGAAARNYPYLAIVFVEATFSNGETTTGSGVVVGQNDVLTASHVVFSQTRGGAATSVRVTPGYNEGSAPVGSYSADLWSYYSSIDPDRDGLFYESDVDADLAILGFSERLVERTGSFGMSQGFESGQVNVTGFPGRYGTSLGVRMTNDTGNVTSVYDGSRDLFRFGSDIEINPGNSGGPLWYYDGSGLPVVVGVVSTALNAADFTDEWSTLMGWISGNDYLMGGGGGTQTDDFAASASTTGVLTIGGSRTGVIETAGDHDWFRVTLSAGTTYTFELNGGAGSGRALDDPFLSLRSSAGAVLASNDDNGTSFNSRITFTAAQSGQFYLDAGEYGDNETGAYTLTARAGGASTDDFAASASTTGALTIGGSRTGVIETAGDHDWFRVTLSAGATYTFELNGRGTGAGALSDPVLALRSAAGAVLASNDDFGDSANSRIRYAASQSGEFYLDVGGFNDGLTGAYTLTATGGGSGTPVPDFDVFRFFNANTGGHFFTRDPGERAQVLATRPDLRPEGVGFDGFATGDLPGTAPVYRFFNTQVGGHFFTQSVAERDQVLRTRSDLRPEGISFYEFSSSQGADTEAVYRFFNKNSGGHFFTTSVAERNQVQATRADMTYEGISFFAPTQSADFFL